MKKIISICLTYILCCLLMQTAFAASTAETYYIYEDMEKGSASSVSVLANSTGATYKVTADATGRSLYAYKVSIDPAKSGNHSYVAASKNKTIPVKMGTSYKSSLMVYMANGLPRTKDTAIVFEMKATTIDASGNPSKQMVLVNYEIPMETTWKPETWTRLSGVVNWSETLPYAVSTSTPLNGKTIDFSSMSMTRMYFRIGNAANNAPIMDRNSLAEGTTFDFYFDDMVYEPCQKTDVAPLEYDKNLLTYGDFENGSAKGFAAEDNAFSLGIKRERSPISGDDGRCLNIANRDGVYAQNAFSYNVDEHADIVLLPNHMYEFTFWYRVNELFDEAGTCGYNNAQNTPAAKGDVYMRWNIGDGSGEMEQTDLNGMWTTQNRPITKCAQEDILVLDGAWHNAKISFRFDNKTFTNLYYQGQPLSVSFIFQAHQSKADTPMHMNIDLDDVQLIDCGPLTNGDFEELGGYATRWVNNRGTGASANNTTYGVYGWVPDGCRLYQSDTVRANPLTGSTKSMQVVLNAGGRPLQSLSLTEKGRYKLSFWAMDETLQDGESMPLAVVLERVSYVGDQAGEIYKVPEYEFYTGTYEKVSGGWIYNKNVMDNQQWRITNEWQYFETYISNDYPVIAGKETEDTEGIFPRQPYMFFVYNGTNPQGVTYYLDDVKLEKAPDAIPIAENIRVNGVADPGGALSVSYDYIHPEGVPEGDSIVHVYADGAAVETFSAKDGTYTVKERDIGKSLSFEVLPIDENGVGGEAVLTKNMETTWDWTKVYLGEDGASARAYSWDEKNAKFIFAAYCKNQLVDMKIVDATLSGMHSENLVTAQDFKTSGADKVKVMLWNGTDTAKPIAMYDIKEIK